MGKKPAAEIFNPCRALDTEFTINYAARGKPCMWLHMVPPGGREEYLCFNSPEYVVAPNQSTGLHLKAMPKFSTLFVFHDSVSPGRAGTCGPAF